ncbi:MAG: LapA family protein [Cyanobacteriota bacterium]|nr:LapA family protein [Cyanobacteriota bacterium]
MAVIRLILLVTVLGGLMLLLAQNWSPAVPLVFLGLQTRPISLAVWMLLSTAAGVCTSLLISSLLKLSSRSATQRQRKSDYEPSPPKFNQRNKRESEFKEREFTPPAASSSQPPNDFEDSYDDWDLDRKADDWDFEEKFEEKEYSYNNPRSSYTKIQDDRDDEEFRDNNPRSSYTKIQDDRDYEDFREDFREPEEPEYDSVDSPYSYEKSELDDSDEGERKVDSVYDADYRVIIPPANSSTTSNTFDKQEESKNDKNDDDDWGFLDEDFDSDKKSPLK